MKVGMWYVTDHQAIASGIIYFVAMPSGHVVKGGMRKGTDYGTADKLNDLFLNFHKIIKLFKFWQLKSPRRTID